MPSRITLAGVDKMSTTSSIAQDKLHFAGLVAGFVSEGSRILIGLMNMVPLGGLWTTKWVNATQYFQLLGWGLVILVIIAFAWKKPFIGGIALIAVWLLRLVLSLTLTGSLRTALQYGLGLTWSISAFFGLLLPLAGVFFIVSAKRAGTKVSNTAHKLVTSRKSRNLRLAGLTSGLIAGVMYIQWLRSPELISILIFLGVGLVIFGSVALASKIPLAGGILLIIESLWPLFLWASSPLFPSSEALGLAMFFGLMPRILIFLCLPILISGVLFTFLWIERRSLKKSNHTTLT